MSKIMLIDEKMNTTVIELSPQQLQILGVKAENIKKHTSRRQLIFEMDRFIRKFTE